ncbi:MAG: endonuclease III [Oscillospiraceae bacterium]|nr:endonuclease III [Oscillospiraceae bacterium]
MDKKNTVKKIISELKKLYPEAVCSLTYSNPVELLIATRLSAQCTDARVNLVTPVLFAKYPTLDALCDASPAEIGEIIKPCGLFNTKARDISSLCRVIKNELGGEVPDTIEQLVKLPGVGRKTANLIVGDIFGKPAIVADTHCIRISGRLGLCDSSNPVIVERQLRAVVPPSEGNALCHRLVLFGREICTARSPKCGMCPLVRICKFEEKRIHEEIS